MPVLSDEDVGLGSSYLTDEDVGLGGGDEASAPPSGFMPRSPEERAARNFYDEAALTGRLPVTPNSVDLSKPLLTIPRLTGQIVQDAWEVVNAYQYGTQATLGERPTTPPSELAQIISGGVNAVNAASEGLTSPEMLATLPLSGEAAFARPVAAYFGGQMLRGLPEASRRAGEVSVTGTPEQKAEAYAGLGIQMGMTYGAGKHAASPTRFTPAERGGIPEPVRQPLTPIQEPSTIRNAPREPNQLQAGTQAESGVDRATTRNDVAATQAGIEKTTDAWLEAVAGNDPKAISNAEAKMFGESVEGAPKERQGVLDSADRVGAKAGTSGAYGEVAGSQAVPEGARSPQEQQRAGQQTQEFAGALPSEAQPPPSQFASGPVGQAIQQLRNVSEPGAAARGARTLRDVLSKATPEAKQQIIGEINASIRQRFSEKAPLGETPGDSGKVGAGTEAQAQALPKEGNAPQDSGLLLDKSKWTKATDTENLKAATPEERTVAAQKPLDVDSFLKEDAEGYRAVDADKLRTAVEGGHITSSSPAVDALLLHFLKESDLHPLKSIRMLDFTPTEAQMLTGDTVPFHGRYSRKSGEKTGMVEMVMKQEGGRPVTAAEFMGVLTHELGHNNVTSKFRDAPPEIQRDVTDLFTFVKEKGKGTQWEKHNALSNAHELWAELADPKVYKWLSELDYSADIRKADMGIAQVPAILPRSIRESALGRFYEIAKKLLKLPDFITDAFGNKVETITALDQMVSLSHRLEKIQRTGKAAEANLSEAKDFKSTIKETEKVTNEELLGRKGGATGFQWELGAKAKTAEDVAALRQAAEESSAKARELMKAGDMQGAMAVLGRQPQEAYEYATGVQLDGKPKWPGLEKRQPGYVPPVPDAKYLEAKGGAAKVEPAASPIKESLQAEPTKATETAISATTSPAKDRSEHWERALQRMKDEDRGVQMLEQLHEEGVAPDDVVSNFWKNTYPSLPNDIKVRFQRYVTSLTGFKPGDSIGSHADGRQIIANSWAEAWPDVPTEFDHLKHEDRGLVALMETANRNFQGATKGKESTPMGISKIGTGKPVGLGAAVPQEFPGPPTPIRNAMNSAAKGLRQVRATVANLWRGRNVRDAMSYMRDRGYTAATIFAKRMSNDIAQPLRQMAEVRPSTAVSAAEAKRQTAENRKMAPSALTFFREAEGNPDRLAAMRQQIVDSKAADPTAKRNAVDAIDWALYHQQELSELNGRYGEITDAQMDAENANGIDTLRRKNYVMHAQDFDVSPDLLSKGGGEPTGFRKVREHQTYADSIAAGVTPKSLNAVDLLESRLRYGQQMINSRAWVDGLKQMTDPGTKRPIGTDMQVVTRSDGSTYQQAPEGYHVEQSGRQPIAIHNGYEGLFHALTDQSFWTKSLGGRSLLKANAVGKSVNLMFDTFHLGRVALWQSLIKGLGITTFKAPFPSYKKGLNLLDFTPDQIRKMGINGEIPADWVKTLVQDRRKLDLAVNSGFNIGGISDALYSDWIHNVPGIGTFNKWLFQKFQRGAMTEAWLLEFDRLKNARPNMSDADAARQISKDLNTRFGNLGRQGLFKSKSAQDTARLFALAPQWNEGLIRSELGAIKQLGQAGVDLVKGRKLYAGTLGRAVGGMALAQFMVNQIINIATRGQPTWDNEEEGFGAKISAWIPDKIGNGPGFFLHPLGLAAETAHLIMSKYEKTDDFGKSLNDYSRSRSSAAMRPILTFMTRHDTLGRAIRPDNVWGEVVKSAIPAPIGGSAITHAGKQLVTGEPSEAFPGQFQKQAMASVGIKTEGAPSAEQRISSLARKFNKERGIEPAAEFYAGDFEPLTKALRMGNMADAEDAMEELLAKKPMAVVEKHYRNWSKHPFTGQKAREHEFKGNLTDSQREAYEQAKEDRKQLLGLFLKIKNQ